MLTPTSFLFVQKEFQQDVGHSPDLGQRQSGILLTTKDHKENGTESLNWWWSNSEKADTQFSEPRVHCLEERSKAKEVENCRYTSVPMEIRLKLFFAQLFLLISSVSTEQSQICVMNTVLVKQERGDPCWQDNVTQCSSQQKLLMTTPTPSTEVPAQKILHKYKERVERLPLQDRLIKICTGAGFLTTVEVGQYFMTKHTDEFLQFTEPVTCREYTLPRDGKSSDPKGWIRGNTQIGPVLEVTTSYLQGKYGVVTRHESVNKDNSHAWVRISHGLNKLVTDLNNHEQETSEMQFEEYALKLNAGDFASRPKATARPRRPYLCLLIYKNCTDLWKNMDWCRASNLFSCRLPSGKKSDYSSSTRRITSRRRWRNRILETERWFSVRIWEFSTLVWWNVEE